MLIYQLEVVEHQVYEDVEYVRFSVPSTVLRRRMTFGICRSRRQSLTPTEIHYFFHGANGDDRQFVVGEFHAAVGSLMRGGSLPHGALFVLPHIETSFLTRTAVEPSFYRYFHEEFLPMVESQFLRSPVPRYVSGMSMGAFAALNLFFEEKSTFQGVLALSPALLPFDFFDEDKVSAFQLKYEIPQPLMDLVLGLFKSVFPTYQNYLENDPLARLKAQGTMGMDGRFVYLGAGDQDELGAMEGMTQLRAILKASGIPLSHRVEAGGKHDLQTFRKLLTQGLVELHSFQLRHQVSDLTAPTKGLQEKGRAFLP